MPRTSSRWTGALLLAVAVAATATPAAAARDPQPVKSVVVLGDSVAAGEGTLDGYVYRDRALLPGWATAGNVPTTRHDCGRSQLAYGMLVARALSARVTNLACSGASFERGITLDARYDRARPDLVLVTAGANAVSFERAFSYCVLAAQGVGDGDAASIADAGSIPDAVARAIRTALQSLGRTSTGSAPGCTAANPGSYLQRTVLDRVATVAADARALAQSIRARGRAAGRVPQIVFTKYPDPLPLRAESIVSCPDAAALGSAQLAYMRTLFDRVNAALDEGLRDVPGVRVVDPDPVYGGHRWCDADPWVYGPSILVGAPSSWAPFHPTPAGQRAIATTVLDALAATTAAGSGNPI